MHGFEDSWRRAWQPTPVFLPEECLGQRNMAGYSLYGHNESDMTEVPQHTHAHIVVIYGKEYSTYVVPYIFMIYGVIFRSLIHLEFIFEHGFRECSDLIILHIAFQFSQQHL